MKVAVRACPHGPGASHASTSSGGGAISTKAQSLFGKNLGAQNLLLVAERSDEAAWLSARNLPQVHILEPGQLNTAATFSLSDDMVFTQAAFESLRVWPQGR